MWSTVKSVGGCFWQLLLKDLGITLLGDPYISYLSQSHVETHTQTHWHGFSVCVRVSPLPTASVRSCSYYKAASTSFTLLAAVSAKHDFYSTQLCLEDAQQMRVFLFPVLFIKKQTILSDSFVRVREQISTHLLACIYLLVKLLSFPLKENPWMEG